MGRKLGSCAPFGEGDLGPHLTHCGQGRGLHVPARQVSSWSIQPFGHYTPTLQTDEDRPDNGLIAYRANRFTNGRPKCRLTPVEKYASGLGIYLLKPNAPAIAARDLYRCMYERRRQDILWVYFDIMYDT